MIKRPYWIVYQEDYSKEGRGLFKKRLLHSDPRVRTDAYLMLGEYGALEDISLLLDLAQLPLQSGELEFEREILHRAMQRLAHRSAEVTVRRWMGMHKAE